MTGEVVDDLFRRDSGRVVSTLTRILGPRHLALAEDVAQEALVRAIELWPHRGVPANPSAWLIQTAKNLAIDWLRRESSLAAKADDVARALSPAAMTPEVVDDQLAMMFLCCHPEIPREARVALTLKTVCGFGTGEIARAFLIQETAAAQRIVRAKRLIRERDLKFEALDEKLPAERKESVLEGLYLMFNEGYASAGDHLLRSDLCKEAIRLAGLLADHATAGGPECDALLALFLLQAAREGARVDEHGDLLLLEQQDRSQWNRAQIAEGIARLGRSAQGERVTRYHLEAEIAALHASALKFDEAHWRAIAEAYALLYTIHPTPIVTLNRAVALARAHGPHEGLKELEKIEHHPALERYHLLPAALAVLWREAGNEARAAEYFDKALALECSAPERRHLQKLSGRVTQEPSGESSLCRPISPSTADL
ncbi:MAG TPA: sigma-70 family RNA polymerase sigma factor [Bryobacteraceae bacterium]|jgi:RNA polymerase sigma-70 factor (ECF subfamily)|nr:sigma-70 family RNA polymerase sigma factor [Bryobacteraceae bacterium]